jgi:hypothetical protein
VAKNSTAGAGRAHAPSAIDLVWKCRARSRPSNDATIGQHHGATRGGQLRNPNRTGQDGYTELRGDLARDVKTHHVALASTPDQCGWHQQLCGERIGFSLEIALVVGRRLRRDAGRLVQAEDLPLRRRGMIVRNAESLRSAICDPGGKHDLTSSPCKGRAGALLVVSSSGADDAQSLAM